MPLRGVPRIISPALLKILAEMGHGDELCLADCNFPAQSIAEAHGVTRALYDLSADNITLLSAILKLMPLDQYVDQPAAIMRRVPADEAANFPVPIYFEFQTVLDAAAGANANAPTTSNNSGSESSTSTAAAAATTTAVAVSVEQVERFAFYERARRCFAIVQTGERRQYGNIIIKKGVLRADE